MPNWCENELIIKGSEEILKQIREAIKSEHTEFDFDKVIPYPEEFKKMDEVSAKWEEENLGKDGRPKEGINWSERPRDGFNQGGYGWCVENWGTKWNNGKDNVTVQVSERALYYTFDSPWSPPVPVIKKLGEMFPFAYFELEYWEGGMGFKGMFIVKDGEVMTDESDEYYGGRGG